jgi:hypothetical protein
MEGTAGMADIVEDITEDMVDMVDIVADGAVVVALLKRKSLLKI